jgi:Cell division protein
MKIGYFITQSIKGLWRNGVMSFASIMVLMSCLVVIGGFSLIVVNVDVNLEQIGLMNEIAVFTHREINDPEALAEIEQQIRSLDNVASVRHVTPEEGLKNVSKLFVDPNGENTLFENQQGENNPLSHSFIITYKSNDEVSNLTYQLNNMDSLKKVTNKVDIAMKIETLKDGIILIFVWFLAILFIVSLFVIINTIKQAVYSRRTEIIVMRYVGATNWFISLPFVFEGIFIGIIAAIFAFIVESYVYAQIVKMVTTELQMLSILQLKDINIYIAMAFLAIGICTGIIGSCISLTRYLKS